MPRRETSLYQTERQKWQTIPQAVIRFHHVPQVELIIPTENAVTLIANQEDVAAASMFGFRRGAAAGQYDYAQSFVAENGLSSFATLEIDLYLRKVGAPSGNVTVALHASTEVTLPDEPPNTVVIGNGDTLFLADGTPVQIFSTTTVDGAGVPAPAHVGSVIQDPNGPTFATVNEGSFANGVFLHGLIPSHTIRFPAAAPMANGGPKTLSAASVSGTAAAWYTFLWNRTDRPAIVARTLYWIVLSGTWTVNGTSYCEVGGIIPGRYGLGSAAVNTQAAPTTWAVQDANLGGDALFRVRERVTTLQGFIPSMAPFSRDFSSGTITQPTRPYLECIESIGGSTQTVEPHRATSSLGNLTVVLTDLQGEILRHCGAIPGRITGATPTNPGPGQSLFFNEAGGWVGQFLPERGTIAIGTERIRYDQRDAVGNSVRVVARGVDGTTAQTHAVNTLAANGEEIRQGQRVSIILGYQGLAGDQWMEYGNWEVVGRKAVGASVHVQLADMQRHLQKTLFLEATPEHPTELEAHPLDIALIVLLSTGTGVNLGYDILPADQGIGLAWFYVDIDAWVAMKAEFPAEVVHFSFTGPIDGKDFMEQEILKPLGCWPYIDQFGRYSLRRFRTAPAPATVTTVLTEDDIGDFEGTYDGEVINELVIEYDFNLPEKPDDFATRSNIVFIDSRKQFGRRTPWTLRSHGLRTSHGAGATLNRLIQDIGKRYGTTGAAPMARLFGIPYRRHTLEIGDLVKVSHPMIPNLVGGIRGITQAICEVQNITPTFLARGGGLTVELLYVGGIPTLTGGWKDLSVPLPPDPPPAPTGLELVIDGVGQGNSPIFWGRDATMRINKVGPVTQEPLETEPNATGPTIEGYWVQILSADGTVLKREGLTTETQGTYTWDMNTADNGGTPVRTFMVRVWTQLVGGTRSSFPAQMSPNNLAPSMAGFTPTLRFQLGAIELDWSAWPVSDMDLEKYEIQIATSVDPDWTPGMTPNKSFGFHAHPTTKASSTGNAGVTFRVRVIPYDVFGAGAPSETVEGTIPVQSDTQPPAAPTGLTLSTGFDVVAGRNVSWAAATWNRNTVDPDVSRYLVRYRQLGTTDWTQQEVPHPPSGATVSLKVEAMLPQAMVFEAQVAAEDFAANLSAFAPEPGVQITLAGVNAPADPTGLTLSSGTTLVDGRYLGWGEATWSRNTEGDMRRYNLRYRQLGTTAWTVVSIPHPSSGSTVTYRTEPVLPMTMTFEVQVQAEDWDGFQSTFAPGTPSQITIAVDAAPATPTGLALSTGTALVDGRYQTWAQATWNRNTESDMARYLIRYKQNGTVEWTELERVQELSGSTVSLRIEATLPMTMTFDVQIAAQDRDGHQSAWSSVVAITIAADTGPATPTGLSLASGTTLIDGRYVTWAEATWTRNTESDMLRYLIRYRQQSTTEWTVLEQPHPTSGATVKLRVEATLPSTMTFDVQILAEDRDGHQSAWSSTVAITVAADSTPAAPTGVSLSTGAESVVAQDGSYLAWAEATWTRSSESDILRYNMQAKRQFATQWESMGSIPQTPSGNPVIRFEHLPAGVVIDARVQAEDRDGHQSAWSSVVSITLGAFATAPGTVTGLASAAGPTAIFLAWQEIGIPDLAYYEVHEGATPGFAISGTGAIGSGTCLSHTGAAAYVRPFGAGTVYPITLYHRIVVTRVSGARGSPSGDVGTTVLGVATSDVKDGAVTTIKLATGAVTQIVAAAIGNASTTTQNTYMTIRSVSITTQGGVVHAVGSTIVAHTSTGGLTNDANFKVRIRNTTDGVNSGELEFHANAPAQVGDVVCFTPQMYDTPTAAAKVYELQGLFFVNGVESGHAATAQNASLTVIEFRR